MLPPHVDDTAGVLFLGEVSVTDLVSGAELAAAVNYSYGTIFNNTQPWLKWVIDGKTVLYSKKPYRHSISWNSLKDAGIVFGGKTVVIKGQTYSVSLPMGRNPDLGVTSTYGFDTPITHNSEWNRLMYPITKANANNPKLSQVGPDQHDYVDTDFGFSVGSNGAHNLCVETDAAGTLIMRGNGGVSRCDFGGIVGVHAIYGWRPRLELIP